MGFTSATSSAVGRELHPIELGDRPRQRQVGEVEGHQLDLVGHELAGEVAEVGAFQVHHPRVLAQLAPELPEAGVDRVHPGRAVVEEHGREATGRRAAVERDPPVDGHAEPGDRGLELGGSAEHQFGAHGDRRRLRDPGPGVQHRFAAHEHPAGLDGVAGIVEVGMLHRERGCERHHPRLPALRQLGRRYLQGGCTGALSNRYPDLSAWCSPLSPASLPLDMNSFD